MREAADGGPERFQAGFEGGSALRRVQVLGERGHRASLRIEVAVRIAACCEQLNGAAAGGAELVLVEVDAPSREQDERDLDVHLVAFGEPVLELREEGALRRIVHSAYDGQHTTVIAASHATPALRADGACRHGLK